jgi:hypothetical protein
VQLAAFGGQSHALPDIPSSWSTSVPIQLSEQEIQIFMHFVRTFSTHLDFFDPSQQFASVVPQLALRNTGLMKALLALSGRRPSIHCYL